MLNWIYEVTSILRTCFFFETNNSFSPDLCIACPGTWLPTFAFQQKTMMEHHPLVSLWDIINMIFEKLPNCSYFYFLVYLYKKAQPLLILPFLGTIDQFTFSTSITQNLSFHHCFHSPSSSFSDINFTLNITSQHHQNHFLSSFSLQTWVLSPGCTCLPLFQSARLSTLLALLLPTLHARLMTTKVRSFSAIRTDPTW